MVKHNWAAFQAAGGDWLRLDLFKWWEDIYEWFFIPFYSLAENFN